MQYSVGSSMMKVRARRRKFGVGSLIVLVMLGIIFLLVGLAILTSKNINASWARVTGTVSSSVLTHTDDGAVYAPVVTYNAAGQTYTVTGDVSSSSQPLIGSSRQVAYDPQLPSSSVVVESGSVRTIYYLVPLIGVVMLIIGPLAYGLSRHRRSDLRQLEQGGQKHPGVIVGIQTYHNGKSHDSYRLIVAAKNDTGSIRNYVSDLLLDIGALVKVDVRAQPIPIDVYIDPAKPDNYYVDVSEVPNLTAQRLTELIQSIAPPPKLEMATPDLAIPVAGSSLTQSPMPVSSRPPLQ